MLSRFSRRSIQGLIAAGLLLVMLAAVLPAAAQDAPTRTITVTGIGSASGTPDQAILSLGVELRSDDLGAVVEQVNETIAVVIDALVASGVAPEDIQTTNFSVYQELPYGMPEMQSNEQPSYTYVVTNMVQVRVTDIAQLNTVIDAGLSAGANRIFGLTFGFQDQSELEDIALESAVADANARAATLAAAIGAELGEPIIVRESASYSPYPREVAFGLGGGGSFSEGQLSVSAQVEITYSVGS